MTTATQYGFGVRQREPAPARHAPAQMPDRFRRMQENAERLLAEPFMGITADGTVVPGLFPLEATGVSTRPIKDAADAFLAALDGEQGATATFPIDTDAWRRWYNIHPFVMRHGLLLEELDAARREAALDILRASLSAGGFRLARDVMKLNHTIGEITGSWDEYGEWVYFLSIMGTPSLDQPWGWQIDGHHLNLNCFILKDQLVMTPAFFGSEPVHAVTGAYAGTRVFQAEEQDGLELIRSLPPEQQQKAILAPSILSTDLPPGRSTPLDERIRAGAFHDNLRLPYEGLRADELSAGRRDLLLRLVETYVGRMRPGHDTVKMEEVKRHLDETSFAWMGGTDEDSVFYYRVHSPVILIEFDHQRGIAFDNDEPSRNHIHTIVRTPNGNDYGKDLLRQHYERSHHRGEAGAR